MIVKEFVGGERIVISTIEHSFTASRVVYDNCVPQCETAGITSNCTEGALLLEKRKQLALLRKSLAKNFSVTQELPNSDIFRTIYFATAAQQKRPEKLTLIVFSDMIENSDFISGKEFFSSSSKQLIDKLNENDLIPNFAEAKIIVFGIGRGGTLDRKPLKQSLLSVVRKNWKDYFSSAGAHDVQITESYIGGS